MPSDLKFRIDQIIIYPYFILAPICRDQGNFSDGGDIVFQECAHQTDGPWYIVSRNAVFNGYLIHVTYSNIFFQISITQAFLSNYPGGKSAFIIRKVTLLQSTSCATIEVNL